MYDNHSFTPSAKVVDGKSYSIISDYLGTPILSYDENGRKVWERELDIYGKVISGDNGFIPFLYQGQYYDAEIELAYNRFRYYSPDTGMYISQDPIGLEGGMPNFYAYVKDSNSWIDPFGLTGIIYLRTDPNTSAEYIGKSKSPESFARRQSSHNSKLRKSLGKKGDSSVKYNFKILEEDIVGKDNLAFREETNIRKKGGIAKDGGPLENKIHGMNDKKYKDMGGNMDKLGNKKKKITCH